MDSKSTPRTGFAQGLFNPAIALMNQLRFPQKFALISLLFLLPLAFVLVLFIWQTNANIDLVDREMDGTAYLRVVRNLYQDALQNEIEVAHFQNGRISAEEVTRIRSAIARDMQTLGRVDEEAQGVLETKQVFQTLKADWQQLQAQPLDQAYGSAQDLNTQLVADIRSLISEVGDSSNLFLDPRLDSHNLIDALVLKLPGAQNRQAEALALDIAAMAQQGSTAGLARTSTLMGMLESDVADMQDGVQSAFQSTSIPTVQLTLETPLKSSVDTSTAFVTAIGRAWNAPGTSAPAEGYWPAGSSALQASFELWDAGVTELDNMLQARSDGLNQQRLLTLGITIAVLVLVVYLWVGFYRAVMRTVSGMEAASRRMVSGDMSGKLELDNRDELGQIVASFNRIASALVSSSAHRQAVVDNAVDGIFTVSEQGTLLSFNPAAERIFGYSTQQAIGSNASLLLPAATGTCAREMFARLLGGEHLLGHNREVQGRRQNGAVFPLDLAVSETQGAVPEKFYVGIARDITELKQAQMAVQESQQRLADIISFMPDPVLVIDEKGKVIAWNRAIEEMTGTKAEDMLGKGDYEYALPFYGERRPILIDLVTLPRLELEQKYAHIKMEGSVLVGETYVTHLKGGGIYLLGTASALHDSKGNAAGAIEVIRDLTERKHMEEDLHQAKEAAEAATQAKSAFLATMSHEIRTPMNAVIGMTGLLLETPLNAQQQEFAETIRTSGDALLTIINDILDFSKIEAGRMELERQPFVLRECVESAVDLLASRANEKGLNLACVVDAQVPQAIFGDVTRLRQILVNLVGNSLKFTEHGEVVVTVSLDGNTGNERTVAVSSGPSASLHFAVRDTGLGIPPDRMDRLFHSFSQVDASTTRRFGGTGLGLAISKRLCELMGGNMWVESEGVPGKGSVFHFTIQAEATTPPTPRAYLQGRQPRLEGKRVLIVDDNPTNRRILNLQTCSWNMVPCETGSPKEALAWIQRGDSFDIGFLDLQMPEMDGITLAAEIRRLRKPSELPLVMLSSAGEREANADKRDFVAFLVKPIKGSQLYNILVGIFGTEAELAATATTTTQLDARMAERHPLRILLAEDNAINQKLALLVLERLGYRADVAGNGLEVLESVRRQPYDVILMDMQMPEMDGLEATRVIGREFASAVRPRIVAMTANAMKEDRDECFAAGMDDFVTKPIQFPELIAALNKCQARSIAAAQAQPAPIAPAPAPTPVPQPVMAKQAEAETAGEAPPAVLDLAALKRLRNTLGKQADAVLPGLIENYFKDAPKLIADAHRTLEQKQTVDLRRAAHTLKSTSATFGAMALSALARELEYKARDGALDGAGELLSRIETEYAQAKEALVARGKEL